MRVQGRRSNGCKTCRRRKVKCDETHPACDRCKRAHVPCEGYQVELKYIDEGPRVRHQKSHTSTGNSEAQRQHLNRDGSQHVTVFRRTVPTLGQINSIDLSGFKETMYRAFLIRNIYGGGDGDLIPNGPFWWLNATLDGGASSATHSVSTDALGAAFFGRVHHQNSIMTEGAEKYGTALQSLKKNLTQPQEAWSYYTLTAVTALSMYELIALRSPQGWIKHAGGIGRLLEFRGPWMHKQEPDKSIFVENRIIIAIRALISRKSTFLSQEIWKTVPWEDDPGTKKPVDYLTDYFCDLPSLVEKAWPRVDPPTRSSVSLQNPELLRQALSLLEKLKAWKEWWARIYPNSFFEIKPCTTLNEQTDGSLPPSRSKTPPDFPYGTPLHYTERLRAIELCLHNATCILALEICEESFKVLHATNKPHPQAPTTAEMRRRIRRLALEICRSLGYLCHDSRGLVGKMTALFPARVAHGCFEPGSKEAVWLLDLLGKVPRESGLGFGGIILEEMFRSNLLRIP